MQLRIIRNYHGFACQEYLGGVTSFITIFNFGFLLRGAVLLAMERTFTGPCYGIVSEHVSPPNDTGDKLAVSVDFNRIIAAAINVNPGWFFAWAARPAHHR